MPHDGLLEQTLLLTVATLVNNFFQNNKINAMYHSAVDSNRFNFNIYRDVIEEISPALWQELFSKKVDVAILRLASKKQHELHLLDQLGIPFIVADTLVEYSIRSNTKEVKLMNEHMNVYEPKDENDWKAVDMMVEKCFGAYSNHYYSNPYLDKTGNIEGYKEWVRACSKDNGVTFIVEHDGNKAGFFSLQFKDGIAHGAPGGIIPQYEGAGLYLDFHKILPSLIAKKGLKMLRTSTQVQNLTVQRQWTMSGWNFTSSALTLHLNTFIDKALKGKEISCAFTHNNLVDFLNSQLAGQSFQQMRVKEMMALEQGAIYDIFISAPIENVSSSGTCTSVLITKDEKLIAIAWLMS